MKSSGKKKILALMTSITMIVSYAPPALAMDNTKSVFTSANSIMCGYDQIYSDGAGSSWAPVKPNTPKVSQLKIQFEAKSQGEEYSFKLMDGLGEGTITYINGSSEVAGNNTVLLEVPGNTEDGTYKLVGKIGSSEEVSKDITIENNLALDAVLSSSDNNTTLSKLNDLTIANYTAKGGSNGQQQVTLDPSVDMTFKFNKDSTINHIDIYSNNVDNHGPVEFRISYKDGNGEENVAGVFSDLKWEGYIDNSTGAPRKRTTINLTEPVKTNELKVSLTKTNQNWGNKYVIDEIMVWGHEDNDEYKLSVGQNIGAANQINTIILTGKAIGNLANEEVDIKLVKGSEIIKTDSTTFKDGVLEYQFTTLENIQKGTYQIVVTSKDGKINKTFNYTVRGENTYESDIDSNLVAYSGDNKLVNLFDGEYSTYSNTSDIKIWNKEVANDKIFSIRSIKVYAGKDSIKTAELLIATNARKNDAFARVTKLDSLSWENDDKGDYIEFYLEENFLSHAYELKFDKAADIKEIDVTGVYFENNLFESAKVKYNGTLINGYNMFDNIINSELNINGSNAQGVKEMELSFEDGNIYELSQLFLSANYPESQGIKSVQVSYLQDGQWIELDKVIAKYLVEQAQKRQMCVVNLPNIQTTKLKLKVEFNTTWGKGIITELNAVGRKYESGKAIASLIDHVDTVNSSTQKLSLNWLEEVDKKHDSKYQYSLASSSDENIIDLDGNLRHTDKDENVTITYNVIDKENNKFKTGNIEVKVPKALGNNLSQANLQIDKTTAYKNPAMGWVAYVEGFECAVHEQYGTTVTNPNAQNKELCLQIDDVNDAREYWRQMDELIEQGMPINILYIRQPWSWFEPKEGEYAWNDPNSPLSILAKGAKERGIQLALRVLTCSSATKEQATPQYVFDAGATGVRRNHDYIKGVMDPHLNNPIFKDKFKTFVNALGKEFNNEDTAFIDANGHGQWGEMNAMVDVSSGGNVSQTVDELAQFYVDAFPDVLLGGQLGSSQGRDKINESFKVDGKNFVIRRDAFGSPIYLPGDEAKINEVRNNGVPLFAENCYHHFDSRDFRWSSVIDYPAAGGGPNEYGGDDPYITIDAMMNRVVDDAIRLRANTIDLRVLEDCKLWVSDGQKYLDRFTREGGYRISVTDATYTNLVKAGEAINIDSTWQNNGVGILPNKNKHWNNKMKVAYALIDKEGKIVQEQIISTDEINLGNFEKGQDYSYKSQFNVDENIATGTYRLAISVLNEKDDHKIGVQLANKGEVTNGGWLILGNINVNGKYTLVEQVIEGQGTISFDKEELLVGQPGIMTVTPKKGYEISYVEVNGEKVELTTNNEYKIEELPYKLNIKVIFKSLLETTIEQAEELKINGGLENVIPEALSEFEAALEEAKTVLADKNATESQIESAKNRLINAIKMLEFKKGDKTELIKLIEVIKALDESKYTSSTWAVLQAELEKANKVIANENAMEEEVVNTYDKLNKAYSDLKLVDEKPSVDVDDSNKDNVKVEVINIKPGVENIIDIPLSQNPSFIEVSFGDVDVLSQNNGSVTLNMKDFATVKLPFSIFGSKKIEGTDKVIFKLDVVKDLDILKDIKAVNKVFDFSLVAIKGNEQIKVHQFEGGISEVKLLLTDEDLKGLNKENLVVLYYNEETKQFESVETIVNGNEITFKTSHFSKFVVAEKNIIENVDKNQLIKLVGDIKKLDAKAYILSTWLALNTELENANKVIANKNATKEQVSEAYNKLIKTYFELRLIPDKSKLEDLINKCESIDLDNYTKESVDKFNFQLANAKSVLKNEEAIQKEVDEAAKGLELAFNNLVVKESNVDNDSNNITSDSNNGNSSNGNNSGNNSDSSLPSTDSGSLPVTGGTEPISVAIVSMISILLGLILFKKKR